MVKNSKFSTQMMQNLMMDLLDFAQIQKNTFNLNKEFFSMFDVIQEAFHVIYHAASHKNVQLIPPETSAKDTLYYQ